MSSLIPFKFESQEIRVVTINGEPLFSARDVALALGYENPSKAYQDHCKWLKKLSYNESLELGFTNANPQGEYVMPEGDVYRLAAKSRLESAQRFEAWVYDEVIPSVRKTGKYETKKAKPRPPRLTSIVSVHKSIARLIVEIAGVKPEIAAAVAIGEIQKAIGIDAEPYRKSLPSTTETVESLNATNLGKAVGMTAREANQALADLDLQQRNERGEWDLTDKGKEYGAAYPFARNGHASHQILWLPTTTKLLGH